MMISYNITAVKSMQVTAVDQIIIIFQLHIKNNLFLYVGIHKYKLYNV